MFFKNKKAETSWSLIVIVALVAVVGIALMATNGSLTGKATAAPGTGTSLTKNIDVANACNAKLNGGAQLAKAGASAATVDDAALDCLKSAGGSASGGQCDVGADNCCNTFALDSDPDCTSILDTFDLLDANSYPTGEYFTVTNDAQVIASAGAGGGVVCAKDQVDFCFINYPGKGCELGSCIQKNIMDTCVGLSIAPRLKCNIGRL